MGPLGKLWVEVCIIGYLMGCCIAYLVVLGDLGPEILATLGLDYSLYWSRIFLMTTVSLLVILPLSLLRDIESLNLMSTVSVAIYLLLVLKVILTCSSKVNGYITRIYLFFSHFMKQPSKV
jgi:solute carrier family 38 (sodium-coupled neutral amino acid transporter), member 10